MRHVRKRQEPQELATSRTQILATPGVGGAAYDQLPATTKAVVLQQCLEEQGFLCAYSGVRVEEQSAHVEHMFPQSHTTPEEQLSYWNMVACFRGPRMDSPGFGAVPKRHWPAEAERSEFVRPTDDSCEVRFTYSTKGRVKPTRLDDAAARTTIVKLRLNDDDLVGNRHAALVRLSEFRSIGQIRQRLRMLSRQY